MYECTNRLLICRTVFQGLRRAAQRLRRAAGRAQDGTQGNNNIVDAIIYTITLIYYRAAYVGFYSVHNTSLSLRLTQHRKGAVRIFSVPSYTVYLNGAKYETVPECRTATVYTVRW